MMHNCFLWNVLESFEVTFLPTGVMAGTIFEQKAYFFIVMIFCISLADFTDNNFSVPTTLIIPDFYFINESKKKLCAHLVSLDAWSVILLIERDELYMTNRSTVFSLGIFLRITSALVTCLPTSRA